MAATGFLTMPGTHDQAVGPQVSASRVLFALAASQANLARSSARRPRSIWAKLHNSAVVRARTIWNS